MNFSLHFSLHCILILGPPSITSYFVFLFANIFDTKITPTFNALLLIAQYIRFSFHLFFPLERNALTGRLDWAKKLIFTRNAHKKYLPVCSISKVYIFLWKHSSFFQSITSFIIFPYFFLCPAFTTIALLWLQTREIGKRLFFFASGWMDIAWWFESEKSTQKQWRKWVEKIKRGKKVR